MLRLLVRFSPSVALANNAAVTRVAKVAVRKCADARAIASVVMANGAATASVKPVALSPD